MSKALFHNFKLAHTPEPEPDCDHSQSSFREDGCEPIRGLVSTDTSVTGSCKLSLLLRDQMKNATIAIAAIASTARIIPTTVPVGKLSENERKAGGGILLLQLPISLRNMDSNFKLRFLFQVVINIIHAKYREVYCKCGRNNYNLHDTAIHHISF